MIFEDELTHKNVLFITTKNIDYLRNAQEIEMVSDYADEITVLGARYKSYFRRLILVYFRLMLIRVKKYDVIFVGFSPQLIIPFFYRKFRHKVIISDFFISLYDTMVNDRKKFSPNSLMGKICKSIDKKTIRESDYTVVDTKSDRDYFAKDFGLNPLKTEVIYLKADNSIYYPREKKQLKRYKNKFLVLYFGSILPLQGVDVILDAVDLLKSKDDIHFIIIGPIEKKQKNTGGENVTYIRWLSQEKLAKYISYSDLCLAGHFNKDIDKAKRTIAGKTYIFEAMNKPIILGENKANHELFKEDDRHFFVEMGDGSKLAEKILEVKEKLTI